MAGDWIKMRADLHTHPKVVRIASALDADRLRVVGALHATWCLFDAHSVDGELDGYSSKTLNDMIGFEGFAQALIAVGWLEENNSSLCMPRFSEHNGQSAKRRAQEADRKRNARKSSASDADKKRTREEKRREDLNPEREAGATDDMPPVDNPDTDYLAPMGKFPITPDWLPGTDFTRQATLWGINLGDEPGYTAEELQQFRDYWTCEGRVKHQMQWEQTFAQSLRTSRVRQQIPSQRKPAAMGISQPDSTIPPGFRG
ncbi:DnaT-like ssDNA-binding domain-containing protein [Kluyvera sp. Awk 3]|uniref:DnaT-like ssDNA-binding domain-containing protein n=1 Tax=Kluyvera sp. Awk 3 TaxID=2963956 RepID=UPI00230328BC|nr:DnaT-like ssDNA-binding domain-containing protein [Kluyvera sp. Awk 3]MDA8487446.1 DnaT-like ssDNA-binding domain-containing protein [Kluyvera sp. Awk 3]